MNVPLNNHGDIGLYHVHVYLTGKDGKMHFLKASTVEISDVPESGLNIISSDLDNGTADINIYVNRPKNSYKNVYVEAWTTSDKKDLYRYEGQLQKNGTYKVQFNVRNHGYHVGEYRILCYVEDTQGNRIDVAESTYDVELQSGEMTENKSVDGRSYTVTLSDVRAQGIANAVTFMIWSDKGGQDDIVGYTVTGSGNTYTVNVPVNDHGDEGVYHVHAYLKGKDGKLHFLKSMKFDVTDIPESEMQFIAFDEEKGTFDINIYANQPKSSYAKLYVKAWTLDDLSDVYCYEGIYQSNGTYNVRVDVKNHGYHMGKYQMVCYIEDKHGNQTEIVGADHVVSLSSGEIIEEKTEDGYSTFLTIEDVKTQGIAKWITFMVWSDEGGQDDIQGYSIVGDKTTYTAEIPLNNHGKGLHHVHIYLTGKDGKMHFLKSLEFDVADVPEAEIKVVSVDENKGKFNISVYPNYAKKSYTKLYIEAWTMKDQSDKHRYEGQYQSNGMYSAEIDVKNHGYHIGEYQLICYVENEQGKRTEVVKTTHMVQLHAGEIIEERSSAGYTTFLTLHDVKTQGIEKNITFMVWSDKGGQDDIKGYTSTIGKGNNCTVEVPLYNHKDTGVYQVHAYLVGKDGKMHFLTSSSFEVDDLPEEGIEVTHVNEKEGTFDVDLYLSRDTELLKEVYVYVWSGANDFTRYTAKKQTNGSYKVSVNALNHYWTSGQYNIHAYIQDPEDELVFFSATTIDLNLGTKVVVETIDTRSVRMKIWGMDANILGVKIPTWETNANASSIYWYKAEKNSDGSWSAVIHTKNHKKAGKFISHIYVETKDALTYFDSVEFNIAEKWENTWRWIDGYKRYINSNGEIDTDVSRLVTGPYMIKVYKRSNYLIVFAKDENGDFKVPVKAMITSCGNATPTGTFYTPNRWRWLTMLGGSQAQWVTQITGDFLFHSVPYRLRRNDTLYVDNMFNHLGETRSAGCVRLQAGNAKWIYDNCALKTKVIITVNESGGPIAKPSFTKVPSWHTWDPTDPTAQYLCQKHGCH